MKELRKLRAFFVENNISLNEVAFTLSITRQSVYNKLQGKTSFTDEEKEIIKNVYGAKDFHFTIRKEE